MSLRGPFFLFPRSSPGMRAENKHSCSMVLYQKEQQEPPYALRSPHCREDETQAPPNWLTWHQPVASFPPLPASDQDLRALWKEQAGLLAEAPGQAVTPPRRGTSLSHAGQEEATQLISRRKTWTACNKRDCLLIRPNQGLAKHQGKDVLNAPCDALVGCT